MENERRVGEEGERGRGDERKEEEGGGEKSVPVVLSVLAGLT